jgi:hypothetical protein
VLHTTVTGISSAVVPEQQLSALHIIKIVVLMGPVNPTGMFPSCHRSSGTGMGDFDVADDKDGSRLPAKRTSLITMATFNKMVVD